MGLVTVVVVLHSQRRGGVGMAINGEVPAKATFGAVESIKSLGPGHLGFRV